MMTEYIHAVAIVLQSWFLINLWCLPSLPWSPSPEQLVPKTSATAPWQRMSENTELTVYVLHSNDGSD